MRRPVQSLCIAMPVRIAPGLIVALVLDLVGVSRPAIAADYALVGDSTIDVATLVGAADSGKPEMQVLEGSTILRTLEHLDEIHAVTLMGCGRQRHVVMVVGTN